MKMNLSTNPLFTHCIEKLCTICHVLLKDTDTSLSIFSTLEELESPMNVLQVLQSFSNYNFYNGAQIVCTTCYNKAIEVYKFIQMCNQAHENMQHYLKNIEVIKTIEDVERVELDLNLNVKIEEISISPTRSIIDGREFLDEMENEKISNIDEMEMIIPDPEIKIEESSNEEITISHTEIETEGTTGTCYFNNVKVERIDPEMHDEPMGLIKCKDCHLVFSDEKELGYHQKEAKHTKETKYNLICHDQRYNAKSEHISEDLKLNQDGQQPLRDHEIDVKCEELYICVICKRGFAAPSHLRSHLDSHLAEKVHKCEQCDQQFTLAANLRRHMDIHNGVKAYKCEQCDRRFTRAEHLRSHMDMHNGVKAHKCNQCDRRFSNASNLRRHMVVHNRKLP